MIIGEYWFLKFVLKIIPISISIFIEYHEKIRIRINFDLGNQLFLFFALK